jgi:hypothetical protein
MSAYHSSAQPIVRHSLMAVVIVAGYVGIINIKLLVFNFHACYLSRTSLLAADAVDAMRWH